MYNRTSFGSWLKQQRKIQDWTQAQLAGAVGCSVALIRKFDADEHRPSKQIAQILADVLGIPLYEREGFLAHTGEQNLAILHRVITYHPTKPNLSGGNLNWNFFELG